MAAYFRSLKIESVVEKRQKNSLSAPSGEREDAMLGLGTFLVLVGIAAFLVAWGLTKIPPVYKGILLVLGKRTSIVLDEGWRWLIPNIMDIMLVDMHEKTHDVRIGKIFTPDDQAEITLNITLTYLPDEKNLLQYVAVENHLDLLIGKISEAIRSFVNDKLEGPRQWKNAVEMTDRFTREILSRINAAHTAPDTAQEGKFSFPVQSIGIVITGLNITNIQPNEALRKALANIAEKAAEKDAETIRGTTAAAWIYAFLEKLGAAPGDIAALFSGALKGEEQPARLLSLLTQLSMVDRRKAEQIIKNYSLETDGSLKDVARAILPLLKKEGS